jgi:superfamily I DNA and/or RNA helicase
LGFLKNFKRLNVAITRAQALLVVVGSADVLKLDPHWCELIDYARSKGCYVGPEMQTAQNEALQFLKSLNERSDGDDADDGQEQPLDGDIAPRPNDELI